MKMPQKCKGCEYYKIYTHGVVPYQFCLKLHTSFSGGEPEDFLNCGKNEEREQE